MNNHPDKPSLDLSAFIKNECVECVRCGNELITSIGTAFPLCINCIDEEESEQRKGVEE